MYENVTLLNFVCVFFTYVLIFVYYFIVRILCSCIVFLFVWVMWWCDFISIHYMHW